MGETEPIVFEKTRKAEFRFYGQFDIILDISTEVDGSVNFKADCGQFEISGSYDRKSNKINLIVPQDRNLAIAGLKAKWFLDTPEDAVIFNALMEKIKSEINTKL